MDGRQTDEPSPVCAPNPLIGHTRASDPFLMGVIYGISLKLKGLCESPFSDFLPQKAINETKTNSF